MRTPFTTIIERLRVVGDLANVEADPIGRLYSMAETVTACGSLESIRQADEPRPAHHALTAFLEALPTRALQPRRPHVRRSSQRHSPHRLLP